MNVSIIIINYNTFELTCNCIESVIKHTKEIEYEIILVDNASNECNPKLFVDKFSNLKLIVSEANSGFAGGNNLGIAEANGEYILLLNSDTWLEEDAISKSYKTIIKDNQIGSLSCKLIGIKHEVQPNCFMFNNWWRFIFEKLRIKKLLPKKIKSKLFLGFDFEYDKSIKCDGVWGTFFLFKKSILNSFEDRLLPNNFFMYFEEMDWCMSFKKLGFRSYFYNETYIRHIGGASTKKLKYKYDIKKSYLKLSVLHKNYLDYLIFKILM
jgi:GT2 family glycosyltransferase